MLSDCAESQGFQLLRLSLCILLRALQVLQVPPHLPGAGLDIAAGRHGCICKLAPEEAEITQTRPADVEACSTREAHDHGAARELLKVANRHGMQEGRLGCLPAALRHGALRHLAQIQENVAGHRVAASLLRCHRCV